MKHRHTKIDPLKHSSKWNHDYNPNMGPIAHHYYEFSADDWQLELAVDDRPSPEQTLIQSEEAVAGVGRQELLNQLFTKINYIIDNQLTDVQSKYLRDYYWGKMTYTQVASLNGRSEESIRAAICGIVVYEEGKDPKEYGGALKKIKKTLIKDGECLDLLKQLRLM
jgi:hypothetical protein